MVGTWGSVQADWTILFALLIGWYLLIKRWERNGTLDRWNATRALGIVLMVRTQRGQRLLERMARPRRFWRAYGEVSLWVCSVSMLMVGLLVLLAFITSVISSNRRPSHCKRARCCSRSQSSYTTWMGCFGLHHLLGDSRTGSRPARQRARYANSFLWPASTRPVTIGRLR